MSDSSVLIAEDEAIVATHLADIVKSWGIRSLKLFHPEPLPCLRPRSSSRM